MKSGAINLVVEGSQIDTELFPLERQQNGETLRSALRVRGGQETFSGLTVRQGRTMREDLAEIKTRHINADGELEIGREVTEKQVDDTEFFEVNSEFVITETTRDDAARELLSYAMDGSVQQALIDVVEFAKANPSAEMNMAGTDQGSNVDHITAVGDIRHATDLPDDVRDHPNILLGFEGLEWEQRELRGFITKSGYLAIYEPSEMNVEEYSRFVRKAVLPFATPDAS
ncbi:hypothetical protein [Haloparvum sp. PAK95]|uniref:hypothetical protein n=1 Tax=Haloparvum sp. PAK95 TaxID=3418962 RepID=UPI003D2F4074